MNAKSSGAAGPRNDEWTIGDFLDRRALIETTAKIAATWDAPLTIGICAPWGEGKTSTMRMIQRALDPDAANDWDAGHGQTDGKPPVELPAELRKQVKGTVWFDPWQYQFENSPASSLVRTILQTAEKRDWVKAKDSGAFGFFKGMGLALAEGGLRVYTKGSTGIGDVKESIVNAIGPEALGKSFAELFQEKYQEAIDDILAEDSSRLVIFLDDLDRCQPEYVVRMLEALKLTLLNPRCVYVLGIDDTVVASAVRDHYRHRHAEGQNDQPGFDGERYLEKIIQLPIRLPGLMDDLADQFIGNLITDGAELGKIKKDESQWRPISNMLLLGLKRNPRHAKRFVMLIEFTLALAETKLKQASDEGKELPVTKIDKPLLIKLQMLQFSWPELPRDASDLKELEQLAAPLEEQKPAEEGKKEFPGVQATKNYDALWESLGRWGVTDRDRQEKLREFFCKTQPRFKDIKADKVMEFHIHLVAATSEAEPEATEEDQESHPINPREFSVSVEGTFDDDDLVLKFDNQAEMKLLKINPGKFRMGSLKTDKMADDDERPRHSVGITHPFYMGVYPVTQGLWDAVMSLNPSYFRGQDRPVEQVSWYDAAAFCNAVTENLKEQGLTARLPTEAEWEYACRAGTTTRFWFGDDVSELAKYAWINKNSKEQTQPVGAEGHANPWGLSDMLGNIWEWCSDWFGEDYYASGVNQDPQGPPTGNNQVIRGGSWLDLDRDCQCAFRNRILPNGQFLDVGFRVVLSSVGR